MQRLETSVGHIDLPILRYFSCYEEEISYRTGGKNPANAPLLYLKNCARLHFHRIKRFIHIADVDKVEELVPGVEILSLKEFLSFSVPVIERL
ncbi:hypothetical protein HDU97_009662 [Phlyctochytrium planicorne]|nr:hypothetical protein HDU97_009662 [Phlyctochytrium planicorne]